MDYVLGPTDSFYGQLVQLGNSVTLEPIRETVFQFRYVYKKIPTINSHGIDRFIQYKSKTTFDLCKRKSKSFQINLFRKLDILRRLNNTAVSEIRIKKLKTWKAQGQT